MLSITAKRTKRELFGDDEAETQGDRKKDMDPVMLMRYGEIRRKDKGVPIACDCGAAIHVATSKEPSRRGQRYFTCFYEISDGPGEGCGFRRWWEEAMLEEFALIKEEKEEMQKRLDEANKRIDSQEGRIYEMQMQYEEVMQDRKQVDDYGGELFETGMGLAQLTDKHHELERRFEACERKYKVLDKYL